MARQMFLVFTGLVAGSLVAAGAFAFIVAIGLVQRMAARTYTASRVRLYETFFIAGGVCGNLAWFYRLPIFGGAAACLILGLAYGIFAGTLIMSLAETLHVVPVFFRRLRMTSGLPWVIACLAAGKMAGSFFYFWAGIGGG